MAFRKRPSSGPVLLLLLFIAVSPARAATIDVAAGDVTALRNAITTANGTGEDDTIVLPSGSTFSIAAPNNGVNALPVVTSKLIIQGNDAVIQRTGKRFGIDIAQHGDRHAACTFLCQQGCGIV